MKEKIEFLKKKATEYKSRVVDKEKEMNELNRKHDEEKVISEKNMEIMNMKLSEQKESFEHKIMVLEEDNHRKIVSV